MLYYATDEGKVLGPFSIDAMRQMRQAGLINDDTLVAADGDKEWVAWLDKLATLPAPATEWRSTNHKSARKPSATHDLLLYEPGRPNDSGGLSESAGGFKGALAPARAVIASSYESAKEGSETAYAAPSLQAPAGTSPATGSWALWAIGVAVVVGLLAVVPAMAPSADKTSMAPSTNKIMLKRHDILGSWDCDPSGLYTFSVDGSFVWNHAQFPDEVTDSTGKWDVQGDELRLSHGRVIFTPISEASFNKVSQRLIRDNDLALLAQLRRDRRIDTRFQPPMETVLLIEQISETTMRYRGNQDTIECRRMAG